MGAKKFNKKEKLSEQADPSVRIIEDQIPAHIPIKVKLHNLDIEPLYRNLEIEVTNTSIKPIYFLELIIILPDVEGPPRSVTTLPLQYGRTKLVDIRETPTSEDVPLRPGESHLFKMPEDYLERLFNETNFNRSGIKTIQIAFQVLNFGDNTGYTTTGGLPVPDTRSEIKNKGSCGEAAGTAKANIDLTQEQLSQSSDIFLKSANKSSFSPLKVSCHPGDFVIMLPTLHWC